MAVDFSMDERSDSDAMQVRMGTTEEMHRWLTRKQKNRKNDKVGDDGEMENKNLQSNTGKAFYHPPSLS